METLIEVCFGAILITVTILVMWVLLAIAKEFKTVGVFRGLNEIAKEMEDKEGVNHE